MGNYKMLVGTILAIAVLAAALVIGGLLGNRVPLTDPPGLKRRLATYFTTHSAQTTVESPYAELRPRSYPIAAEDLLQSVHQAILELSWEVVELAPQTSTIKAVVHTKLWRFKDDVSVRVEAYEGGSRAIVHAQSRLGKGDLGANTRHILDLHAQLNRVRPGP